MPKSLNSAESLIQRLDVLLKDRYKGMEPEKSFIKWFVEAEYGEDVGRTARIFDASGDGGIDAIFTHGKIVTVIQSRYGTARKIGRLDNKKLRGFRELAHLICDADDYDYEEWLSEVRPAIRDEYRRMLKPVREDQSRGEFVFITNQHSFANDDPYVQLRAQSEIASLAKLYFERKTPPFRTLKIRLEHAVEVEEASKRFRTFVGVADVRDFMLKDLDTRHWETLFAANVRTELHSTVNDSIQRTYEEDPSEFWLFNNGLYIVCEQVQKTGGEYTLRFPSIINGSQTLHSIRRSAKSNQCRVMVRILEMRLSAEKELLESVVRYTNSQNPMRPYNLIAHREEQTEIASELNKHRIFYERRQNEWRNEFKGVLTGFAAVQSVELAQWTWSIETTEIGTARSKPNDLISDKNYPKVFGRYFADLKRGRPERMRCVVLSGLLANAAIKSIPAKRRQSAKLVRLSLVAYVHAALKTLRGCDDMVIKALTDGRFGRTRATAIPKKVVSILDEYVSEIEEALARYNLREDEELTLANAYKRDAMTKLLHGAADTLKRRRELAAGLQAYLTKR